jgi:hypothetical protein
MIARCDDDDDDAAVCRWQPQHVFAIGALKYLNQFATPPP